MIDLHTHSNISDGTDSPEALVQIAVNLGITTIALCDHDTTAGLSRFLSHATRFNLKAIPGIEISAEWKQGNCHILGLNVDVKNRQFESILQKIRDGRELRNMQICEKLKNIGTPIDIDDIAEFAKGEIIARPHIAMAMMKKGYCTSIDDAFNRYLSKGAPAYVNRYRLSPIEAVSLLKNSGARVIIAHPTQLNLDKESFREFISTLIQHGLDGIEVFTPYTPDSDIAYLSSFCKDYSLLASGGSDYHGTNKPDHHLGHYRSDKCIPESVSAVVE